MERRKMADNQGHNCPLSHEDAYQLIFEMKTTREKITELNEKMGKICDRVTVFERIYNKGEGVAIGIKLGGILMISGIIGVLIIIWSAITGKISFSDILKLF